MTALMISATQYPLMEKNVLWSHLSSRSCRKPVSAHGNVMLDRSLPWNFDPWHR
jgi:hypothetical protein